MSWNRAFILLFFLTPWVTFSHPYLSWAHPKHRHSSATESHSGLRGFLTSAQTAGDFSCKMPLFFFTTAKSHWGLGSQKGAGNQILGWWEPTAPGAAASIYAHQQLWSGEKAPSLEPDTTCTSWLWKVHISQSPKEEMSFMWCTCSPSAGKPNKQAQHNPRWGTHITRLFGQRHPRSVSDGVTLFSTADASKSPNVPAAPPSHHIQRGLLQFGEQEDKMQSVEALRHIPASTARSSHNRGAKNFPSVCSWLSALHLFFCLFLILKGNLS